MIIAMRQKWWTASAGLGGALLIASTPGGQFSAMLGVQGTDAHYYRPGWILPLVPIIATVLGLCLLRWWPHLLVAGGLVTVLTVHPLPVHWSAGVAMYHLLTAGFPLLVIGVLGCAQSLLTSGAPALGSAVAGLSTGSVMFGWALAWHSSNTLPPVSTVVDTALCVAGLAAVVPALRAQRRGDPAATGLPDVPVWSWPRLRLLIAAGSVTLVALMVALITTDRLAAWLDVGWSTFTRYPYAKAAILGAVTLACAAAVTVIAGLWSLAGAVTAVTVRLAIGAPLLVVYPALSGAGPAREVGVLLGVAIGAAAAASRWRVAAAATLAVGASTALFIAYAGTSGDPQKLADQQRVVPALLLLVLLSAAATAVVGATAPVLAPRGAVPAVLGPIAGVLTVAAAQTIPVIYLRERLPESSVLDPGSRFATSAVLLLVAAAAVAGLGAAHHLAERWAQRKRAELIRQEAAAAERERLARPIHDGVLQVLALVQRQGADLGGSGAQLAALAGEQEVALRKLLSGAGAQPAEHRSADVDLRAALSILSSPSIEVSAPATPVMLPSRPAAELIAAVQAALDNVGRHAGPAARAWILLEDEGDGVLVTVRDDGAGFEPGRLDDAARAGRLGVAQSMRGRISDLGGATTIHSRPGDGTEVEFWVPRAG